MLAEILNVVQVFSPAQAVTVCYCCYCCSAASKQKTAKNPGKTRKYLGFPGYFRVLPALDAGDRRGSLPGLPYCCSAGLTLATVVGEPHCCSVVTVNTSNTVQLLTPKRLWFPYGNFANSVKEKADAAGRSDGRSSSRLRHGSGPGACAARPKRLRSQIASRTHRF